MALCPSNSSDARWILRWYVVEIEKKVLERYTSARCEDLIRVLKGTLRELDTVRALPDACGDGWERCRDRCVPEGECEEPIPMT